MRCLLEHSFVPEGIRALCCIAYDLKGHGESYWDPAGRGSCTTLYVNGHVYGHANRHVYTHALGMRYGTVRKLPLR